MRAAPRHLGDNLTGFTSLVSLAAVSAAGAAASHTSGQAASEIPHGTRQVIR
jgi:hypothetical protein